MTVSLRADSSGNSGAIQINGVDRLTLGATGEITGAPVVTGLFRGLVASSTGLNSSVSVSIDEIVLSSTAFSYVTLRNVIATISTASTGANGVDSGSSSPSTWYSVWIIWNGSTVAGLLSTSGVTPTLPSGYTHKARVGWIRTDSGSNKYPLPFRQIGKSVQYTPTSGSNLTQFPTMASGTANGTAVNTFNFFPSTVSQVVLCTDTNGTTASAQVYPSAASYLLANNIAGATASKFVNKFIPESTNVYWNATGASCVLYSIGWEDNL